MKVRNHNNRDENYFLQRKNLKKRIRFDSLRANKDESLPSHLAYTSLQIMRKMQYVLTIS